MKKLRRKPKISTVISMIFLILCSVIFIYPLFYLLFYSLKTNNEIFLTNPFGFPHDIQWVNYSNAIKAFDILAYFKNSIIVSIVSIVGILFFVLPFSYATTNDLERKKRYNKLSGIRTFYSHPGYYHSFIYSGKKYAFK